MELRHLGRVDYLPTFEAMQAFTAERTEATEDELWLCEHPPVFTQGLAGKADHVLMPGNIPVVQTNRGGQVTYHGPGQAIAYLLFDLRRDGRRLLPREFVFRIEQAVIETLATYNCVGERKADAPGIYVAEGELRGAKIAALGLKIRANGCTYHGVSVNVAMDLQPFEWINPCGYPGLATVDLRSLGVQASLPDVQDQLARALEQQLMP